MNDKWLDFAIRIQSIVQVGLQYGKDKYDKERIVRIEIAPGIYENLITNLPDIEFDMDDLRNRTENKAINA